MPSSQSERLLLKVSKFIIPNNYIMVLQWLLNMPVAILSPHWRITCSLLLCLYHFLIGSLTFDLVHWLAHRSRKSRFRALRWVARAHMVHHQYFDRNLRFNNTYCLRNLLLHVPFETLCQVVGCTLSWKLSHILIPTAGELGRRDLMFVVFLQIGRSFVVVMNAGRDSNHITYSRLPKDPNFFFVGPQYHALHHVDPQNYFGSMFRLLDWVLGSAVTLRGRRVAMTGASGAFGQALSERLELEPVRCIKPLRFGTDWSYDSYATLAPILADTDILILAHGSKDCHHSSPANCDSVVAIIELFKRVRPVSYNPALLPEVWYVGSEAELHGAWSRQMQHYTQGKRAFVRFARAYYDEETMIYRHIVPAAFSSRMGPAPVTARWAAVMTLWWIHRGARYVPVTYTGIAYLNYFRFRYYVKSYSVLCWTALQPLQCLAHEHGMWRNAVMEVVGVDGDGVQHDS